MYLCLYAYLQPYIRVYNLICTYVRSYMHVCAIDINIYIYAYTLRSYAYDIHACTLIYVYIRSYIQSYVYDIGMHTGEATKVPLHNL